MAEWVTAGKVRATPKGVWDDSVAYSVLDMVANSEHKVYYIAKQNVPAGVALTNTAYWDIVLDASNITASSNLITEEELDDLLNQAGLSATIEE